MQLNPRYSIAFDTVWLLALSLNDDLESATRMQNPSIDKNDYLNLANKLRESMKKQDFEGISVGLLYQLFLQFYFQNPKPIS